MRRFSFWEEVTMPKRGNREGSVYQRKSDGKWVTSITLEDGRRKVLYSKTQKEAIQKLKKASQQQEQGTLATGPQYTVAQYLDYWLSVYKQKIRPRSYERYEQIIRLHLVPKLGKIKLDKLSPQHVQTLYTKKLEEGLSTNTVLVIHGMLHKALKSAMRWGVLAQNVCDRVDVPRKVPYEIHPLNMEQAQKLLDVVSGHPNEALFILAIATGMRRGEIAGLKWQDIDWENATLHVQRSLTRVPTSMGGGYQEAEPKTEKSRRSIVLPDFALTALLRHRELQFDIRERAGEFWHEHDYVFCTPLGEHIHPGHDILEELKKLLKKAGLPDIRFHDLRHSAATMLLGMGIHPKIVQERLGHHDIGTTMNIYSHVLPNMQEEAMKRLNFMIGRGKDDQEDDDGQGSGVLAPA
jgi:integrase